MKTDRLSEENYDTNTFNYWFHKYVMCRGKIKRPDIYGAVRLLPLYEREDALFAMARTAEDDWERQIVIECFLKDYGQVLIDKYTGKLV